MFRFAKTDPLVRQLLIIVTGALLLIIGLLAYGAATSYRESLSRAEALTGLEARSLSEHALRTFDRVELQLENLVAKIEQNPSWLSTFQPAVTDYLDQITGGFRFMRSIVLLKADGMLVNDNAARDGRALDLSDRDYFQAHKEGSAAGTFVGRPLVGRVTKKSLIGVSRRINGPDGGFAGVAAVIFEPLYFKGTRDPRTSLSDADEGLIYSDGTILNASLGEIGATLPQLRGALEQARVSGAALARITMRAGDSIVALNAVPGLPLYTMAARPLRLALAEWRKFATQLAGIGAISILVVLGLTGVMWRQLEARRTAEDARARALNDLTLANENLARSNRDLQEFAQVASHDLQEPLRKIRYFSEKLKSEYETTLGESGLDKLARLNSATGRMQRLINDLLDFARITTRAKPFGVVSLDKVVAEVLSDLEAGIVETGAKITALPLPRIMADRTQMQQLFQNLIGNALKYRRADIAPEVRILPANAAELSKDRCRIVFEDNGIGFEQKYSDRIFQPFQRLHGRNAYDGTGMGLAICRKIVERHGGTLTADSSVNEGTRFIVTLPLRQKEEETETCPPEATPSPYSLPTMIPTTAR